MSDSGSGSRASVCIWCGARLDERAEHRGRLTRCAECAVYVTDPPPSSEELEAAYGDWYRPMGKRRFSFAGDAILNWTRALLAARIDNIAPPGPILDVGAGDGTLVDALREKGREAVGLERNPLRPDFRDEPLSEVEGKWAAVIFWHSLEHLPEPGDALAQMTRLLEPDGIVVVAVPNMESLQAEVFGLDWLHLDLPRHLVHLPASAVIEKLQEEGLTVRRTSQTRAGQIVIGWLQGLVGMLPGHPNLYHALRLSHARANPQSSVRRWLTIGAGVALMPFALVASATEILMKRGGSVYVEAKR